MARSSPWWNWVFFLPALVFALWPGRVAARAAVSLGILWLGVVAVISHSERTADALKGVLVREDGICRRFFGSRVSNAHPRPHGERGARGSGASPRGTVVLHAAGQPAARREAGGAETGVSSSGSRTTASCRRTSAGDALRRGVIAGHTRLELQQRLGLPQESCWQYSWSPAGRAHRLRLVCFTNGTAHLIVRKWAGGV